MNGWMDKGMRLLIAMTFLYFINAAFLTVLHFKANQGVKKGGGNDS